MDVTWTTELNNMEWFHSRMELISLTEKELSRPLEFHEKQIILYAKSCRICHQQTNLRKCTTCSSANYCTDHAEIFQKIHNSNCDNQFLCLLLNIALMNYLTDLLYFAFSLDAYIPLSNMTSFIQTYVKPRYERLDNKSLSYKYLFSEYASAPLTLYYGLMNTKLFDTLNTQDNYYVIHIIHAKYYNRSYLRAFEILLHLLCHIQHLTIVMTDMGIYMDIDAGIPTECFNINVCERCIESNRQLMVESYSMTYCQYANSNAYKRPNVILGFGIDFKVIPKWPKMFLELRKQYCPLFLTATSKLEAEKCIGKLYTVLNTLLTPLYFGENKFRSLAPCRTFYSDEMYYHNKYLVILLNLNDIL
ncbi:uncharacterized protein LOC109503963 [Harpegnathos saltator]|uniref:uncharacterized protein LOC109503963 n=1 Tax=Harpegnathos saltator TaxID=610380 RepID=UPI000948A89F|nr:uncharacterized protein LOC109503963 [Harpegnathos saltator]